MPGEGISSSRKMGAGLAVLTELGSVMKANSGALAGVGAVGAAIGAQFVLSSPALREVRGSACPLTQAYYTTALLVLPVLARLIAVQGR